MNKRPILYTSACILSFTGSGIAALAYFSASVFYNLISEWVISITSDLSMQGTSRFYFLLLAFAHTFSLLGVISLWKFRKTGFYIYLLSQLSIIFLPVIFIGSNSFSLINFVFTFLFSVIYFFYYRWIFIFKQSNPGNISIYH